MLYLNNKDFENFNIDWKQLINIIYSSTNLLQLDDFAQPVKPYLRYGDIKNRIIAMPGFIGGDIQAAGIKWISSFPNNQTHNLPRAHSITILNNTLTGVPYGIINTPFISAIRTAAVSGSVISHYVNKLSKKPSFNIGIIGFGVIGKMHVEMILELFDDLIDNIFVYDLKKLKKENDIKFNTDKITLVSSWEEAYTKSDITITCTVSKERYINLPPPKNSLQLNVSLRDYTIEATKHMDCIVVDDWDEVCRENTDIENMVKHNQLKREDALSIYQFLSNKQNISKLVNTNVIMFNPMGMAIYDVAIGKYFIQQATSLNIGTTLKS